MNTSLKIFDVDRFEKLEKLRELDLSNNKYLKEAEFAAYGYGTYVDPVIPNIERINLSGCKSLKTFACHKAPKLKTVNLTGCVNITELDVAYTGVGSVDISKYKKLVTYRCAGNNLTKLDVTKNKKLRTLDCQKNKTEIFGFEKIYKSD